MACSFVLSILHVYPFAVRCFGIVLAKGYLCWTMTKATPEKKDRHLQQVKRETVRPAPQDQ